MRGEAPNKDDSDGYSEGGSDSESSDEDYEVREYDGSMKTIGFYLKERKFKRNEKKCRN